MAPRFGDRGQGDPLPLSSDGDSPWNRDFAGSDEGGRGDSTWSRIAARGPRIFTAVIGIVIAIIFFKVFFGGSGTLGGVDGFFQWWMLLFIGIPLLRMLGRIFRGRGD